MIAFLSILLKWQYKMNEIICEFTVHVYDTLDYAVSLSDINVC